MLDGLERSREIMRVLGVVLKEFINGLVIRNERMRGINKFLVLVIEWVVVLFIVIERGVSLGFKD